MKLVKCLLVIFVASLAACATTENYEKILSSWTGQPVNALIDSWGPPDSEFVNDSARYLTWNKRETVFVPGTAPTYRTNMIGNTAYTNTAVGTPSYYATYSCKTTFSVREGYVVSWRWEGNHCKAHAPK